MSPATARRHARPASSQERSPVVLARSHPGRRSYALPLRLARLTCGRKPARFGAARRMGWDGLFGTSGESRARSGREGIVKHSLGRHARRLMPALIAAGLTAALLPVAQAATTVLDTTVELVGTQPLVNTWDPDGDGSADLIS